MDAHEPTELVDVDPETGTFRATYRYPARPPSTAVATALMQATDSAVTDLDPMYESSSVDPDALDDLFRPTEGSPPRRNRVTFTYSDFRIIVKSYGRIVFRSVADGESR
ncbi:HalOD1 output domain-containing protein [Halorussus litoreus]|uniref:HalOD1 output domain-containing protein n=1 Tax=Halorussus litoreus TaxID=1710536 RepID=UPI000E255548|nr:HalOD1 output domain-containing protein [Halorussus litoreus]